MVKSPRELVDLYYKSVGRNGTLLLNIPPDRHGRWHVNDIKSLLEFRSILDETFARNLADGATVTSSGTWGGSDLYHPSLILDGMDSTFWAADKNSEEPWVEISLGEARMFNRMMLQEPIRLGQRISAFRVEILADGQWKMLAEGTTIGYKRLLRVKAVTADRIRIVIEGYNNIPALSGLGLYMASDGEPEIMD
jgi:alpha-L-fucosidase